MVDKMTRLEESPQIRRDLETKINNIKIAYYKSQETNRFFCKYFGIDKYREGWILKNYKLAQMEYKWDYGHWFSGRVMKNEILEEI